MPSSLRTPKTLSEWEELDYYNRPRRLARLWRPLILVALLVSGVVVGATFLPGRRTAFQAGPVSTAHASFNQDCAQCHTGPFKTLGRLVSFDSNVRSVPDSACTKCHSGEIHHETAIGGVGACADCHKEHRGHAALARISDSQCTRCHADLKRNDGQNPDFDPHVTAFAEGKHPEFRIWSKGGGKDPGHLKFDHKVHLDPEGVLELDPKQAEKQGVPGKERREIKRRKLDCQSCHETDATGRYMQPINYEKHCQSCHPLSVQIVGDWKEGEPLENLARSFSRTPAPHPSPKRTAEVVRGVVRDRLTRFITTPENASAFLHEKAPEEPKLIIPGTPTPPPLSKKAFEWVNHQQVEVERLLFEGAGGCQYCHQKKSESSRTPDGLPEFRKTDVPDRWMEHARFNHNSHRMLDCVSCHSGAPTSTTEANVLLPHVESCLQCHHPGAGAARSDCVECHRYHDPEKTSQFHGRLGFDLQGK